MSADISMMFAQEFVPCALGKNKGTKKGFDMTKNCTCAQCGSNGIVQLYKGKPYCLKHYEMKTGVRDKTGYKPPYEDVEEKSEQH